MVDDDDPAQLAIINDLVVAVNELLGDHTYPVVMTALMAVIERGFNGLPDDQRIEAVRGVIEYLHEAFPDSQAH